MTKKGGKGATRATAALTDADVPFEVRTYDLDGDARSFALEAASALDVVPQTVFKTLIATADGDPVVALVPADATLDLKALANAVGASRAEMATVEEAERVSGYVVGGISPLGMRRTLPTVADTSIVDLATVYVSGGKRGLQVALAPGDLLELTRARTAPLARRN